MSLECLPDTVHLSDSMRDRRGLNVAVEFGKEKQASLHGINHPCCRQNFTWEKILTFASTGLSDKEIEDKVTNLVKTGI